MLGLMPEALDHRGEYLVGEEIGKHRPPAIGELAQMGRDRRAVHEEAQAHDDAGDQDHEPRRARAVKLRRHELGRAAEHDGRHGERRGCRDSGGDGSHATDQPERNGADLDRQHGADTEEEIGAGIHGQGRFYPIAPLRRACPACIIGGLCSKTIRVGMMR